MGRASSPPSPAPRLPSNPLYGGHQFRRQDGVAGASRLFSTHILYREAIGQAVWFCATRAVPRVQGKWGDYVARGSFPLEEPA